MTRRPHTKTFQSRGHLDTEGANCWFLKDEICEDIISASPKFTPDDDEYFCLRKVLPDTTDSEPVGLVVQLSSRTLVSPHGMNYSAVRTFSPNVRFEQVKSVTLILT